MAAPPTLGNCLILSYILQKHYVKQKDNWKDIRNAKTINVFVFLVCGIAFLQFFYIVTIGFDLCSQKVLRSNPGFFSAITWYAEIGTEVFLEFIFIRAAE